MFKRIGLIAFGVFAGTAGLCGAQPFGIDARSANTTLTIENLPNAAPGAMITERVFPELTFDYPMLMVEIPDGSGRLVVVERGGLLRIFPKNNPVAANLETFLDIHGEVTTSGEQGLFAVAFDPEYGNEASPHKGEFYVSYSYKDGGTPGKSRISRFTNSDPDDNAAEAGSEEVILEVTQPSGQTNHKGGMLAWGPDNYLYWGLGDGGGADDDDSGHTAVIGNAQDTTKFLGKMLRIDPRTPGVGVPYSIPPTNMFANDPVESLNKREIYAYGLRNPYRWSFDKVNGLLYLGDVGQGTREEVDIIRGGNNYGWRVREGFGCRGGGTGCATEGFTDPIVDYDRNAGSTVIGGFVYYGAAVPDLYGTYIYADYGSRRIWGLRYDGAQLTAGPFELVATADFQTAGMGQDAEGEVYLLEFTDVGGVYVLRPAVSGGESDFPLKLSDKPALLAAALGTEKTVDGIIPYEPSAKLWSDGALKERYIAVPGLDQAGFQIEKGWDFGEKALIIKNFLLPLDERDPVGTAKRIETRLLYKRGGVWNGFSYEWNEAGTDAQLLAANKSRSFSRIDRNGTPFEYAWSYPSRSQCNQCHTAVANGVLGLNTAQMNFNYHYPASGVTANEIDTLDHIAFFNAALPAPSGELPAMPALDDTSASIGDRARAYLSANCSFCHQPGSGNPATMDLRWLRTDGEINAIDVAPSRGDLGIANARIIAPGDPGRSVLLARISRRGLDQMPPLATSLVDEDAVAVITAWIASLPVYDGRPRGDFNDDHCTDLADFLYLLDNWFQTVDGVLIDVDDFLNLLDNWETGDACA